MQRKSSNKKKVSPAFKVVKWLIWLFYPKMTVEGLDNLPDGPAIIVSNHAQMNGPIACEIYLKGNRYTWCAGPMMSVKTVPAYAFEDFWSQKPKYTLPFYKVLSYIIAPLASFLMNNANTIAVHRDNRVMATFKTTVNKLQEGAKVVVFPEHDQKHNNIIYDFQDKFIDIARLYFKRTGKELTFVPMYIAPKLKKMVLGEPIRFNSQEDVDMERNRIKTYLMGEITAIGRNLPEHTVIPYRNIPKHLYPSNRAQENEK